MLLCTIFLVDSKNYPFTVGPFYANNTASDALITGPNGVVSYKWSVENCDFGDSCIFCDGVACERNDGNGQCVNMSLRPVFMGIDYPAGNILFTPTIMCKNNCPSTTPSCSGVWSYGW